MKADILLLLESGLVKEQHVVLDPITAEAVFDGILEMVVHKDDLDEFRELDYGYKLQAVNHYIGKFGKEIVWLERVEVNQHKH